MDGNNKSQSLIQTSRQAVLDTLNHKDPGRIVVDFGSTTSTGIPATAYTRLKKHLGFDYGDTRVFDVIQQLVIVNDALLDRFVRI